jgi:hypothetical protein
VDDALPLGLAGWLPGAADPDKLRGVDCRDGRPADAVLAKRVGNGQPVVIGGYPRAQRGGVYHPGDEEKASRGLQRQAVPALYREVDQVCQREQRPQPPDRGSER